MSTAEKRFTVALSFPGEHRKFIEQVSERLAEHVGHNRILYDQYYEAEFARIDLDTYLQHLYHDESELIAVFLCAEYEHKDWCRLEWRVVRDLIKQRRIDDIMLLRFDNTEIPGLYSTDGYVWIGNRSPQEVADIIFRRLQVNANQVDAGPPATLAMTPPTAFIPAQNPALAIWQEKLAYLQSEEAMIVDADAKFRIKKLIEEAKGKIREYGGQA